MTSGEMPITREITSPLERDFYVHREDMVNIAREFVLIDDFSKVHVSPRELRDILVEEGYDIEHTEVLEIQQVAIDRIREEMSRTDALDCGRDAFEREVSKRLPADVFETVPSVTVLINDLELRDIVAEIIADVEEEVRVYYSETVDFSEHDVLDAIIRVRMGRVNNSDLTKEYPELDTPAVRRESKLARAAFANEQGEK